MDPARKQTSYSFDLSCLQMPSTLSMHSTCGKPLFGSTPSSITISHAVTGNSSSKFYPEWRGEHHHRLHGHLTTSWGAPLSAGEGLVAAESGRRKPTAIILEPSKDLAEQTHDFMVRFMHYLTQPQLRCELLIGGTNPKQASRALEEGVDIITGTPGNKSTCAHTCGTHMA